jgi:hypothetical protein
MYRRILSFGIALIIISFLGLLAIYSAHEIDPYRLADDHIAADLQANLGLAERLVSYGNNARQLQQLLHLEIAQKLARLIDTLQHYKQWDLILQKVSAIQGADILLNDVNATAHKLADLASALDKVVHTPSVTPLDFTVQARSQSNQTKVTPELLTNIITGLDDQTRLLADLSNDIQKFLDLPLIDTIPRILDLVRGIPIPQVSDLADNVQQGIQVWKDLPDQIHNVRSVIKPDITALQDILLWQQLARDLDYRLTHVRYFASWASVHSYEFFTIFIIGLAAACGGWIGSKLVNISREHAAQRPKIVYAPTPQPQPEQLPTVLARHSLICTWASGRCSTLTLPLEGKITLGSSAGDDVQTHLSNSVRSQVQVRRGRSFYYLEVLDCTFPTLLNQRQVFSGARRLQVRDSIQIGDVTAVYLTAEAGS